MSLFDPAGKLIGAYSTKKDGRYEIIPTAACDSCRLRVERDGFSPAAHAVYYNGANSLWFSFALQPAPAPPASD